MEHQRVTGKRILLVDDDAEARHLLQCLLTLDEHVVTECENGKQACFIYTPGDYDLVITDYDMPEMKGDELTRVIKCLVPSQPVVMITGLPWALGGPENPVNAVLIKPVTLQELRRYIAAVLSPETRHLPFRWRNSKSGKSMGLGLV